MLTDCTFRTGVAMSQEPSSRSTHGQPPRRGQPRTLTYVLCVCPLWYVSLSPLHLMELWLVASQAGSLPELVFVFIEKERVGAVEGVAVVDGDG